MEERRMVFADGTCLTGCGYGYYSRVLWLYLAGMTITEAFPIVSDPEKTKRIAYFSGGVLIDSFKGFTEITAMSVTEGTVTVGLIQPEEGSETHG